MVAHSIGGDAGDEMPHETQKCGETLQGHKSIAR